MGMGSSKTRSRVLWSSFRRVASGPCHLSVSSAIRKLPCQKSAWSQPPGQVARRLPSLSFTAWLSFCLHPIALRRLERRPCVHVQPTVSLSSGLKMSPAPSAPEPVVRLARAAHPVQAARTRQPS
jgi:hypothetical protein